MPEDFEFSEDTARKILDQIAQNDAQMLSDFVGNDPQHSLVNFSKNFVSKHDMGEVNYDCE